MFVVVTNQYSSPLTVKDVKPLGPSYIELLAPDAKDTPPGQQSRKPSLRIAPGQTEAIAYSIKPKSEVVPGKYTLIAAVDVESDDKLAATVLLDSRAKCYRALREPDLHVFAKLFEDCLKRSLEAQAFSGREIGGDDDVLDFLVGHFVDVDLTRQPAS